PLPTPPSKPTMRTYNPGTHLGLLLTRRMEEAGLNPTGFVANDYALLVWGLTLVKDIKPLLSPEGFRDGLDSWLAENAVMKRTFRASAIIAGLIERNLPGKRKTGRQATFSSDILYDTLRKYDPDHIMLKITRQEASRGLVDYERIEEMLARSARSTHVLPPHVTPLAAPLLLEMGRVPIQGMAQDIALEDEANRMMREAGLA
ncbi:MAG: DNA ligase-associated DEXH box helicase, partial [Pseudomonadota bacterium]